MSQMATCAPEVYVVYKKVPEVPGKSPGPLYPAGSMLAASGEIARQEIAMTLNTEASQFVAFAIDKRPKGYVLW